MSARARDLRVHPIAARDAARVVRRIHYSGKITPNSALHFGVFLGKRCHGAMSFGASINKRATVRLVEGTAFDGFLELNRMAFDEALPRNSESRALGYALRFIRRNYPKIEWIISFADATQCGDGTIYRAAGFSLTQIRRNSTLLQIPSLAEMRAIAPVPPIIARHAGQQVADKTLNDHVIDGKLGSSVAKRLGAKPLEGFQLRYVYFLNPEARARLTVPILPFSEIDREGARMARGVKAREA